VRIGLDQGVLEPTRIQLGKNMSNAKRNQIDVVRANYDRPRHMPWQANCARFALSRDNDFGIAGFRDVVTGDLGRLS
jgi:hypothetical protein